MLSLLAPRTEAIAPTDEGAYCDPGVITFSIALGRALHGTWGRIVQTYWDGHRKGTAIRSSTPTAGLPYTHG